MRKWLLAAGVKKYSYNSKGSTYIYYFFDLYALYQCVANTREISMRSYCLCFASSSLPTMKLSILRSFGRNSGGIFT